MNLNTAKSALKPWQLTEETLHAKCRIFNVYRQSYKHLERAQKGDFFVIKSPNWVQVLALTPKQDLILVRQFRFGSATLSIETPAGLIETNETPIEAAQRELLEETGYIGDSAHIIGTCRPNPALQDNLAYFVFIENCQPKGAHAWDLHEELETIQAPLNEVFAAVKKGDIDHALTLTALFYLSSSLNLSGMS